MTDLGPNRATAHEAPVTSCGSEHLEEVRLPPFAGQPGRWEDERRRTHRMHAAHHPAAPLTTELRVEQRTDWGWLRWQAPSEAAEPTTPHLIGVLPPARSHTAVQARRWLTRRGPRLRLFSLTFPVCTAAAVSLMAGLYALSHQLLPLGVLVPLALLIPLYVSILPRQIDAAAHRVVRVIETDPARSYLTRLVVLHLHVVQAAASTENPELQHAERLGHRVLWDAAGLLVDHTTSPFTDARLLAYERHYIALARQAAETAAAQRALDAVVDRPGSPWVGPHAAGDSVPPPRDEALLLPPCALADAATTLGEVAAAHRYAAARVNELTQPSRDR